MLILQRFPEESVTLALPNGDRITVMVTSVVGDKVKLGFTAPADVEIDRTEIRRQKDRAASVRHAVAVAGAQR